MPFLFSGIILYVRCNSVARKRPPSNYSAFDISALPEFFYSYPQKGVLQLAYIPSQSETLRTITERVRQSFDVDLEGETGQGGTGSSVKFKVVFFSLWILAVMILSLGFPHSQVLELEVSRSVHVAFLVFQATHWRHFFAEQC